MVNVVTCSRDRFENLLRKKNVICFGAGQALYNICQMYPEIPKRIKFVVDNYSYGKTLLLDDRAIAVVSIDQLKQIDENDLYIISTTRFASQIVKQLDQIHEMDNVNVFIPYFLTKEYSSGLIKTNSEQIIPKKIHFCWFGGNPMPDRFKNNIETWRKYCPEYEICCWNEDNYDISKCDYMYEAYKEKQWGFVPDYARLDIIYQHGGIYLDTDVEMLRPWDELLNYEFFCGFESKKYVALGLGFGASAGNPIIKEMLNQYENIHFVNPDGTINQIASPVYQTEILMKHGLVCNDMFQMVDNCAVFPTEYFAPIDAYGVGTLSDKSYSIHQYAATWFDKSMQKKKEEMKASIDYIKSRISEW